MLINKVTAADFKSLIGKEMQYGSPGYPMRFIPNAITDVCCGIEFVGSMPGINDSDSHFFILPSNVADEFLKTGKTTYASSAEGYVKLKII